jgi:ABC-type branched-subunit amino acid transport system ATPase component
MENNLLENLPEKYFETVCDILSNIDLKKISILTGPNGSGKSLIRKQILFNVIEDFGKSRNDVFIKSTSMEMRSNSIDSFAGMNTDVDWLATGGQTISNIKRIFNHSNEIPDYLIIDEPELGLSEELQLGLCDYINEMNAKSSVGCLIICHSRIMVSNLKWDNFYNIEGMTEDEWLNRPINKISLDEFEEFSKDMFHYVRESFKK